MTHLCIVHNKHFPFDELKGALQRISDWALRWKMKFNPDRNKQAHAVHFSSKTSKHSSLFITLNNSKVRTSSLQKHLRFILGERSKFNEHLESKINRCIKIIDF